MKKEIERKFLLTISQAKKLYKENVPFLCFNILQGYFWNDDENREFRVRVEFTEDRPNIINSFLTIKEKNPKNPIEREELEVLINSKKGIELLKNCSKFISKRRYISNIKKDNINIEVNVFDELEGLTIAEIEFDNQDQANNYIPSFEFEREVTNETDKFGFNLAKEYDLKTKEKIIEKFESFEKYRY